MEHEVSEYQKFVSTMSGPVCVYDVIHSDLSNFSSVMTNTQFATVSASASASRNGFEGLVLELKPDHSMNGGMVVFLTLWRDVWACRQRDVQEYHAALKANCVHRSFYDFERFLFEVKGTLLDATNIVDIVNTAILSSDYVSHVCLSVNVKDLRM